MDLIKAGIQLHAIIIAVAWNKLSLTTVSVLVIVVSVGPFRCIFMAKWSIRVESAIRFAESIAAAI